MNELALGFDLDGTLVEEDLYLLDKVRLNKKLLLEYFETRKPLFNPKTLLSTVDKAFIITARNVINDPDIEKLTIEYCNKHFQGLKLIVLHAPNGTFKDPWLSWCESYENWGLWRKLFTDLKAQEINKNKIDIYFEDVPVIAKQLRAMCPETKIILYGGRII